MYTFAINMKEYFILLALVFSIFGCAKKDKKIDCHSGFDLFAVTADEVQNLANAAVVYAQDPSQSTCEKYKNALETYVNALEKYETCALEFGFTDAWTDAIQQSREGVQQLQCQ